MGDNFLIQQVKNFTKRWDLAMPELNVHPLFERPEILRSRYTAKPILGAQLCDGMLLSLMLDQQNTMVLLYENRAVGTVEGESQKALQGALGEPNSFLTLPVEIVKIHPISGQIEIEVAGRN